MEEMKMLTASEVAKMLSCSGSTIRNLAAQGKLPFRCLKIGAMWRFPEHSVLEYVHGLQTTEAKVETASDTAPCAE